MTPTQQFIIELLKEGRNWFRELGEMLKGLIPVLAAGFGMWHADSSTAPFSKKKDTKEEG